jgi:hypothetical protein
VLNEARSLTMTMRVSPYLCNETHSTSAIVRLALSHFCVSRFVRSAC